MGLPFFARQDGGGAGLGREGAGANQVGQGSAFASGNITL